MKGGTYMDEKNREFFLNSLTIGNIVDFREEDKMYIGKIVKIDGEELTIQTKNGSVYYIFKSDVVWVKNGTFWPKGIYNALKLSNNC